MGRMSPDYYVQDGVVPRTRLPEVLRRIGELSARARPARRQRLPRGRRQPPPARPLRRGQGRDGSRQGARGGDPRRPASTPAARSPASTASASTRPARCRQMFSERDLEAFERLRRAFDPDGLANPGKVIPTPRLCGEVPGPYRMHPLERIGRCRAFLACQPRAGRRAALRGAAPRAGTVRIGDDLDTVGPRPRARARGGRPHVHGRGGHPAVGLDAALGRHGQRLSLDPPGDPTIGACLAANLSGPLRHRFGAPRDLVLGVTLVLADGTVANAGGKVVKNVAGYDLGKLVCGSLGRLALIAPRRACACTRSRRRPARSSSRRAMPAAAVAAVLALAARPERGRHPPSGPGRGALRGGRRGRARRRSTRPRRWSAASEPATTCGTRRGQRQGAAHGRVRFAPGRAPRHARSSSPEAIVRPAAGIAYVPAAGADRRPPRPVRSAAGAGAGALRPARDARMSIADSDVLRALTSDCVHCGFCLPTCPTYVCSGARRWTRRAAGSS